MPFENLPVFKCWPKKKKKKSSYMQLLVTDVLAINIPWALYPLTEVSDQKLEKHKFVQKPCMWLQLLNVSWAIMLSAV